MYQVEKWALDLTPAQASDLQNALNAAAEFHRRMHEAHEASDQSLRERMVVIAGVGYQTLFRLAYESQFFGLWERMAKITSRTTGDPHREGDGRIPLASATLDNTTIRYVKGLHAGLPNIPAVYNDVFRWLKEEDLDLPDNVYEALSGHLSPGEGESETPNLDGTARAAAFTDDVGLWEGAEPAPARLDALQAKLEAEQLPEFLRVRLL
jgi:hypothetical protein